MNRIRTCVSPEGSFIYGIHKPRYGVSSLRRETTIATIGHLADGTPVANHRNYPPGRIEVV